MSVMTRNRNKGTKGNRRKEARKNKRGTHQEGSLAHAIMASSLSLLVAALATPHILIATLAAPLPQLPDLSAGELSSGDIGSGDVLPANPNDSKLLRDVPMIMTHDSATGYKGDDGLFVKVQDSGFKDQLACGARAFDLRAAAWDDGNAYYQHLPCADCDLVPPTTVLDQYLGGPSFEDFTNFADEHPDELVILYLSHCVDMQRDWVLKPYTKAIDCADSKFVKTFHEKKILYLNEEEDCMHGECLANMTFGEARRRAKEHGQGGIIAITGTWNNEPSDFIRENWNPDVTDWATFNGYLSEFASQTPDAHQLSVFQAHWQAMDLVDTAPGDGGFNALFLRMLQASIVPLHRMNLIQINWFCKGGKAIAQAIGAQHLDQCPSECK